MKNYLLFGIVVSLFIGCGQSVSQKDTEDYFSSTVYKILDFQDHQNTDSILPYLYHKEESIREKAVLTFASTQAPSTANHLKVVYFADTSLRVKKACIYSLGQKRDSNQSESLIKWLDEAPISLHPILLDAIGKSGGTEAYSFFTSLNKVDDYSHSQGLMRYCYAQRDYSLFKNRIYQFLKSKNSKTRRNAAVILFRVYKKKSSLSEDEMELLNKIVKKEKNSEVLKILQSFLNQEDKASTEIVYDSKATIAFNKIKAPYEKAIFLGNIKVKDYDGLDFLLATALKEKHKAIKTAAANALINNLSNPQLIINNKPKSYYLIQLLNASDMALESLATTGIRNTNIISLEEAKIVFLNKLNSLLPTYENPRQKETYLDIINTIAYLKEEAKPIIESPFNRPIDWEHVKSISKNQKVKISTTKGEILIECKVEEAPGSVSNFLKLVDSGYYNNKAFHRVVPNFVIQTGCSRGDGWGAPDWTQRSEFSNYLSYTTGAVGLASAGKDTESIQWFITHTYTPFLDGRYSIFAYVIKGMDVVDNITVGDKVISVEKIP
jgi:cyclophilin family peptidyl-prolyl cis-trans isomerase/HEAT repeat protein